MTATVERLRRAVAANGWRPLRRRVHALLEALQRHPFLLTVAALAIAAGVAVAMSFVAGPHRVWRVLRHPHPSWLGVLVAGQALAYLGYSLAHRGMSLLRHGPDMPLELAAKVVAVGFGPFALDSGFAVDRRALIGLGASPRAATVRVLALGSLEYAVLAPAASAAAIWLALTANVRLSLTLPWAIAVPVGFGLAVWAAASKRRERLCSSRWRVVRAFGQGLEGIALLRRLLTRPHHYWMAWAGIVGYWAGDILSLWAGLRCFGLDPGGAQLVLAYATGYAMTPRSLPLAGVGVTEALMPLALGWVGLAFAPAVAGVAVYRIVGLLLSAPLAVIGLGEVRRLSGRGVRSRRRGTAAGGS